jgi:ATP/maltotriose-dependent transcriptional regulator MalT
MDCMRGMTIMTEISGRAQAGSPASRGASSRHVPVEQCAEVIWSKDVQLSQAAVNRDRQRTWAPPSAPASLRLLVEPLSDTEMRVLQYLPTHLSMAQIACELHVSLNTIRTHMRHVYTKLGTHRRAETVEHARALGLLAPFAQHAKWVIP